MNRRELLGQMSMLQETGWQPDKNETEFFYNSFVKNYQEGNKHHKIPDNYEPILQSFAKIMVFLRDENSVLKNLKKLNNLLLEEAEERDLLIEDLRSTRSLSHKKVLSSVIERELAKLGFQSGLAKATAYLPQPAFFSMVREGHMIKDIGTSPTHGEFTHAIQWLLIGWQQQDTPFLNYSVIELFKQTGDDRAVSDSTNFPGNIWDAIVDNADQSMFNFFNACSPEFLCRYLMNNKRSDLELLTELCKARHTRRWQGDPESTDNTINLFSGKKQYPKKEYEVSTINENLLIPKKNHL